MTDETTATRRTFLKGSAILATPLAVVAPGVAMATDEKRARLQRLEDEAAIRALHREWLARVNGRAAASDLFVSADAARCLDAAVCRVTADDEQIDIAANRATATGRYLCLIETESRLAPETIFAQMALAQGGGITRTGEQRIVEARYAKVGERWMIAQVETLPA